MLPGPVSLRPRSGARPPLASRGRYPGSVAFAFASLPNSSAPQRALLRTPLLPPSRHPWGRTPLSLHLWRRVVFLALLPSNAWRCRPDRAGAAALSCQAFSLHLFLITSSTSGPPIWPGSTFFKRNGALLQDPDIDAATAMMLLNTPPEIQAGFPPGVIQNGARVLSRGIFPGARPLPINPIGSMAVAVRNGITNCRMRTESEQSCGSPVVSGDPKEDHNYSSAKSSNHRSTSPASDSVSSSSADDQYEFATKGSQDSSEGSEVSFQSHESHSETEEEDKKQNRKETKDSLADSGYASQHKKRQHLMKAKKVPSDTLPLKKRRTEKPPESDDEEMKEAAGSLLHLAGIRSCLNNITNRTAKGQKEQKETTKN
uniref:Forkhead box N3 n=1 Tax=Nothoprocta perdicaria TaxID=30464 RepID=A0A8C6YX90_NOTPE